jgi:hypothetical protein
VPDVAAIHQKRKKETLAIFGPKATLLNKQVGRLSRTSAKCFYCLPFSGEDTSAFIRGRCYDDQEDPRIRAGLQITPGSAEMHVGS